MMMKIPGVRRRSYIGENVMRSIFSSVQFSHSVVSNSFWPPWTAAHQASLSIINSRSLLKLTSILCRPLLLLPAFNLSQHQGLLQGVSSSQQMANYWRFSISPSNEYSGLISFRTNWFDLLAVQGTLKSLLQHHSSRVSVLQCSVVVVQLSHLYMATGKTIALTIWTFVGSNVSAF